MFFSPQKQGGAGVGLEMIQEEWDRWHIVDVQLVLVDSELKGYEKMSASFCFLHA